MEQKPSLSCIPPLTKTGVFFLLARETVGDCFGYRVSQFGGHCSSFPCHKRVWSIADSPIPPSLLMNIFLAQAKCYWIINTLWMVTFLPPWSTTSPFLFSVISVFPTSISSRVTPEEVRGNGVEKQTSSCLQGTQTDISSRKRIS